MEHSQNTGQILIRETHTDLLALMSLLGQAGNRFRPLSDIRSKVKTTSHKWQQISGLVK